MSIKIDKIEDGLPISVIVPLSKGRNEFFRSFVLPLIEANNPNEIIINNNDGLAPKKRNDGFKKSTQPFVFFIDDDILLPQNHLEKLLKALTNNPSKAYAYTGYDGIVIENTNHPLKGNFKIPTVDFNPNALRQSNYISTMSLIRRERFPKFDESLRRLQYWDLWLTLLSKGHEGIAVHNTDFLAFYLDSGITSNTNNEMDAIVTIKKKHNLL